jgi:outer membrane protein
LEHLSDAWEEKKKLPEGFMGWGKLNLALLALLCFLGLVSTVSGADDQTPPSSGPAPAAAAGESKATQVLQVDLQKCLDLAMENNHRKPASQAALEAAEAQHQQALSSFWPQVSGHSLFTSLKNDPNFIFPAMTVPVPGQSVTIPANAFGPGFPPAPIPLNTPAGRVEVPQQTIKLMDRRLLTSSLSVDFPLFTGGLRYAKVKQAKYGVEAARQDVRRTDLQVVYDVHRMYYGVQLAKLLHQIGKDALARLEVTLELTERLYKHGSGKVKKTDYLRNKSTVEGVRTMVAGLASNEKLSLAALLNTTGLDWDTKLEVKEEDIPYQPYRAHLEEMITRAYLFNPDWKKLKAGLGAAEAKIMEARSGFFPKVLLTGSLIHLENSYDQGVVSPNNKDNWSLGVMMEVPIFRGFLTHNRLKEAKANLRKMEAEKILLHEGIALQIKDVIYKLKKTQDQFKSAREAMQAATDNRELNERAYQSELVETKDVIEAQIMESLFQAQFQKVLYDHVETKAHLNFLVGREVVRSLEAKSPN